MVYQHLCVHRCWWLTRRILTGQHHSLSEYLVPMAKFYGAVGLAKPIKVGLYPWILVLLKSRAENPGVRATVVVGEKLEPAIIVSRKVI